MKNEALLTKVGVGYSDFDNKEVAEILNSCLVDKAGIKKLRYVSVLNSITNKEDFLSQLIKFSDLDFDFYSSLKTIVDDKIKTGKANQKAKLQQELKAIQDKLDALGK